MEALTLSLLIGVVSTVLFTAPILLVDRRRRHLARGELTVVVYPSLAWMLILAANPHAMKGITNAELELSVLAVATACAMYVRVGLPRVCNSRHRVLLLPVATCLMAGVIFAATPPFRHVDLLGAWMYVRRNPQMNGTTRDAILRGVVLEGMAEGEAWAAGG